MMIEQEKCLKNLSMLTMRVHDFIYPYTIKVIIDYTREIVVNVYFNLRDKFVLIVYKYSVD